MADNIAISSGTGTNVATDDDGTAHHQYVKLEFGADNTQTKVTATAPLPVNLPSVISTVNSTAVVLAAAGVFTGTSEDVSDFAAIAVSVFTSHASATDGFSAQQSSDGTNWDVTDTFTIPVTTAGNGKTFSFQPAAKFFRVVYTNGGTLQTSFRLQTVYHRALTKVSSQRPGDAVSNENDFEQVSAFNALYNGTTWDRMRGDTTNGLDVDVTRLPVDTTASGTITAISQSVAIALNGQSGVAIQITNTWVGTLQFEGTVDGTNWVAVNGVVAGTSTPGTTTTANGVVRVTPAGLAQVRITSTAWTSGTATITLRASSATGGTFLNQSLTAGVNVIGKVGIDQTTPGTTNLVALAANQSVNNAQVNGIAVTTGAGVAGTGTQRVAIATDSGLVLVAGAALIGKVGIDQTTDGTTNKVSGGTLTKGTQGANGFSVQQLNNAGRNQTNYFHAAPILTTAAEVMQSLTGYKSGAAVAATVSPAVVTTGKTYRITKVTVTYVAASVIGSARINLRANLSGLGVIGSPLVGSWQVGMPAAFTAGAAETHDFMYPEGLEFAAGTGIAIGVQGFGAVPTTGTIVGYVMVAIEGYEF